MAHRVLIVDGDEVMCEWLRVTLCGAGFQVLFATGEDAMELLERYEISLVLMERHLPLVDGFSLLWCIATGYPNVPVVVMTTDNDVAAVVETMRLGAEDYLVKPLDRTALLDAVGRALT